MSGKTKIGLMGFGQIGRQLYKLAMQDERFDIVAISDIGRPEILAHLLTKALGESSVRLEGNYLVGDGVRTRLMAADRPTEIPWDVFDVDIVIDATGQFRTRKDLEPHLDNGVKRVIVATLPDGEIDRVILFGVNNQDAISSDTLISAGSASTTATALVLDTIRTKYEIAHASMTSVHAYTSDQSLQDYAGVDYRCSRSGAENIIPNLTPALKWLQKTLPFLTGKMTGYALNVPVQTGSMLDITVSLADEIKEVADIKSLFVESAKANPSLIGITSDPIVSSDVKGFDKSLLVDLSGSIKAGSRIFKLIAWHETLGHAARILDVASLYQDLDAMGAK